jgi:two-component system chemotaxis response regulator CheY
MTYNILVVDDSFPMRSAIKKTIKASGFALSNYDEAEDGRQALEILNKQWVDIVVTDYNMPVMNGLELVKAMSSDEMLKTIPVLVITTEGGKTIINEFLESGAKGYIKKPFTPEEIRDKLLEILGEVEEDDQGFEESDDGFDF